VTQPTGESEVADVAVAVGEGEQAPVAAGLGWPA
jgi:hypothetical protein